MKKLLVMLLAVSMVLSMSVALASCSEDPADSSKAPSSEASTEASKDAETSADASADASVDASADASTDASADASTDASADASTDASEDVSEDESSAAPAIEYKTSPAGTNYALNSTYTVDKAGDVDPANIYLAYNNGTTDWADLECTKLKDGVVGDASAYEAAIAAQAGVTVQYAGTDAEFNFVFDLGDHYGDIKSLVFRQARHGVPNGNNRGFEVKYVLVSDDGINWSRIKGALSEVQIAGAVEIKNAKEELNVEHFDFTYTLDSVAQGKFVKVVLSTAHGYVLQFEELEIRN